MINDERGALNDGGAVRFDDGEGRARLERGDAVQLEVVQERADDL
jgi:hypothetical protein